MLQVDLRVSRPVLNTQEILFPALRCKEKRVILHHGGIDYLQDDQENPPICLPGAGLQLVLQPLSPGLAWGLPPPPPVPGDFPAVLQSPGAAARVLGLCQLC